MKKFFTLVLGGLLIVSCGESSRDMDESGMPYPDIKLNTLADKISYAIGADLGANFNNLPKDIFDMMDAKALENGFVKGMLGEHKEKDACQELLQGAFGSPNGIDTALYDMSELSICYGAIFGDMMRKSLEANDALETVDTDVARKGFAHALFEIDTLIESNERNKMVKNFNDDMARKKGEKVMENARAIPGAIVDDKGWVLVEEIAGNGAPVDASKEFRTIYTLMNASNDTIISTFVDASLSDKDNAQIINTDDIVVPNGWTLVTEYMNVGGKYTLFLPYDLAYGEKGLMNQNSSGYVVQPFSTVIISSQVIEQEELHAFAKKRGAKIIEDAKKLPNTKVGKSGYVLQVLEEGTGDKVAPGSDVQAHYILTNSSGDVVENSYMGAQQGRPAPAFSLNGVIQGWQDAVPEMRKGGRYKLYLPYNIAYGEAGSRSIPPYEALTFEMEILDYGKPGTLTQQQQPQAPY